MHDAKPGDLVYVRAGAIMSSALDNVEKWNSKHVVALVITKSYRIIELGNDTLSDTVIVFIGDEGLFTVAEDSLMTPDEYADAGRLFPPLRPRE